ncbi:hypothetical protein ACE6H2_012684 [Prunus campanulata]
MESILYSTACAWEKLRNSRPMTAWADLSDYSRVHGEYGIISGLIFVNWAAVLFNGKLLESSSVYVLLPSALCKALHCVRSVVYTT